MFPLRQTRPCLALPPGSAHPSPSSSGNFRTFQHSNLSTFRQAIHSSLATAPLPPFPATLRRKSQLIENTAALSPVLATLTRHVPHNPFVCHSCKKHGGWRRAMVNFFVAQTSVCVPLGSLTSASSETKHPQVSKYLAVLPVTSHQSPATSWVRPLPPVTSHQSRITNSLIIRTSKTQDLKSFRIRTYKKRGTGGEHRNEGSVPHVSYCHGLPHRPRLD